MAFLVSCATWRKLSDATITTQTIPPAELPALYKQAETLLNYDIVGVVALLYIAEEIVVKPWLDRTYSDTL